MSPVVAAALLVGAYLVGSISWSYLIVWAVQGRDVRTVGSGNAGATNAMRAAGKAAGIATLLLDLGKGLAAVAVARALAAPAELVGGAAVAVVLGHVYPIFFGFRGGKGVAAAAGALGALAPAVLGASLVAFFLVVAWKRYVSLGSVVAAALFPLLAAVFGRLGLIAGGGAWLIASSGAIACLIILRHAANLRRLRDGTEPRLGEGRAAAVATPDAGDAAGAEAPGVSPPAGGAR